MNVTDGRTDGGTDLQEGRPEVPYGPLPLQIYGVNPTSRF